MNYIKRVGIVFTASLMQFSVQAQSSLDTYFDHLSENRKFMGSAAILFKDSIIYNKSVGFSDVASQKKIDKNTKFRIGSITKTYTAVLTLKAMEEGKINLSDKLSVWFPQFQNADKITIEMMLKHRSGIFNFTEIPGESAWEAVAHTQAEFIEYVSKPKNNFDPDTAYEYSNTNYALIGFILEKIYNKDYNTLIQEKICKLLSLTNTYYSFENDPTKNEAFSYSIQDKYLKNGSINYSNEPGSGGLLSTPVEVNKFVSALFMGKIISPESLKLMLHIENDEYGLGIEKFMLGDLEVFKHTGRVDNYISDYWYFPKEQLGLVTLANATNINTDLVQLALLKYAYGNKPQLTDYDQIENIDKEDFMKIKGTYFYPDHSVSVTISSDGENLIFQDSRAGQMYVPFTYLGNNKFECEDIFLTFNPEKKQLTQKQGEIVITMQKM